MATTLTHLHFRGNCHEAQCHGERGLAPPAR